MYYEKVQLLKKYFPDCSVTTDLIVGFPGETEEEFAQTLAFLENSTLRLCRLYEDTKDVVSIKSYLRLVEKISNQHPSLHKLINKEISASHDLLLTKERNLLLLRRLRDKSLAHNDKNMIHNPI